MSDLFITPKQRNLIMKSESAKTSFKDFYQLLSTMKEVRYDDIPRYPQLKNIMSYYDDLFYSCVSEWEISKTQPTRDLGEDYKKYKRVCDLCGYKYLKIENKIRNKINNKTLIIGTECAKEFGEEILGLIKLAQKDAKRASNRLEVEQEIPGIRKFLESSSQYINSLEIIIPDYLEERWRRVISNLKTAYEEYINDKIKNISIIHQYWIEKDALLEEINSFIEKHKDNEHIATRQVYDWLIENKKSDVIKMIRENGGYLNWAIAHRINQLDYMQSVLLKLKPHLMKMGIVIMDINPKQYTVNIRFRKKTRFVIATIKYDELILNFGGFVFGQSLTDTFDDIFEMCYINDRLSQEKILELCRKSSYSLITIFSGEDKVLFFKNEIYYLFEVSKLVKELKNYYFNDTLTTSEVDQIMSKCLVSKMDEDDYENFVQAREEATEFTR